MTEHYTKSTVSATSFCKKCGSFTLHRIDDGRLGPCVTCMEKLEMEHQEREIAAAAPVVQAPQLGLFGSAGPVHAPVREVSPTTAAKIERLVALAGAAGTALGLFEAAADAVAEPAVAGEAVPGEAAKDAAGLTSAPWMSGEVLERAAALHESAKFWRGEAESMPAIADEAAQYASNLDKLATDMESRPDFYRRKPLHVSDWQWWRKGEAAA